MIQNTKKEKLVEECQFIEKKELMKWEDNQPLLNYMKKKELDHLELEVEILNLELLDFLKEISTGLLKVLQKNQKLLMLFIMPLIMN